MDIKLIIIVIIACICHVKAMEFVYRTGKAKKEIWDIIHNNFGDYSRYGYTKNWYIFIFLIPLLYLFKRVNRAFMTEFIIKLCIIILLRSVTIISTMLPRNNKTNSVDDDYNSLSLFDKIISGGFYDKGFSGHFAIGLLLTLMMFKYNIVKMSLWSVILFMILNMLHLFILSITRSHYTIDMLVSLYATLLVFFVV